MNISLTKKTIVSFGLMVLLIVVSSLYTALKLNELSKEMHRIVHEYIPLTRVVNQLVEHQLEQSIRLERAFFVTAELMLEHANLSLQKSNRAIDGLNKEEVDRLLAIEKEFEEFSLALNDEVQQGRRLLAETSNNTPDENQRLLAGQLANELEQIEKHRGKYNTDAYELFIELNK
jgi:CHASE3 domain sensor protein